MKTIIMKQHDCLPCELEEFTIDGVKAPKRDFGENKDVLKDTVPEDEYFCMDNQFVPNDGPTDEVLARYNLTTTEYHEVQDTLRKNQCIGRCGWCE